MGDPARDVIAAWAHLPAETWGIPRAAPPVDGVTRARGRGWALAFGLVALPCYQESSPVLAGIARRAIQETLSDQGAGGGMGL
jgi:hypothetical protein